MEPFGVRLQITGSLAAPAAARPPRNPADAGFASGRNVLRHDLVPDMPEDQLVKVYVDLRGHWAGVGGESLWAKPVGPARYQLENSPFYAYGLNYLDVVKAEAEEPGRKPRVLEVVERSGHATLRAMFLEEPGKADREAFVESMIGCGATLEWLDARYVAVDVGPEIDRSAVRSELELLAEKSMIDFETCETEGGTVFDRKDA